MKTALRGFQDKVPCYFSIISFHLYISCFHFSLSAIFITLKIDFFSSLLEKSDIELGFLTNF